MVHRFLPFVVLLSPLFLQESAFSLVRPLVVRSLHRRTLTCSRRTECIVVPLSGGDDNNKSETDQIVVDESTPSVTSKIEPPTRTIVPKLTSRDMMMALGTNPRRIALSLLSGAGIALAGNLFGVTSSLLKTIDEDAVEATGLDTYFPRGDFKRYRTLDYTFVVPNEWVADTFLELAKAQRMTQSLDYSRQKSSRGTLPDAGTSVDLITCFCPSSPSIDSDLRARA
jgi:hypothetical protein